MTQRPLLKYPGAKWSAASWIIPQLPAHEIYLEPFFGSGAIFFNKKPARLETINDRDHNVVNLFRVIRSQPEELAALIALTPWAREEYEIACTALEALEACKHSDEADLYAARLFLVRCWQAFGTLTGQKTGWRHSATGRAPAMPQQWAKVPERIIQAAGRLMEAQIECMDALELIRKYNDPKCLIYADPPYVPGTRRKNIYAIEMNDAQHVELLEALAAHSGSVVLSGYDNELYNERLAGWQRIEKKAAAERGQARIEVLWIKEAAI
ncbi:MAG: DNA adenine methylase [Christensenellaceae bacterium]|nr:DNA adenine methylase [Christensenellaceae bacterium]